MNLTVIAIGILFLVISVGICFPKETMIVIVALGLLVLFYPLLMRIDWQISLCR